MSIEILVIATVLVIGLIAAWAAVSNAVILQIEDQAEWITGEEIEDGQFVPPDGEEGGEFLTCAQVVGSGN